MKKIFTQTIFFIIFAIFSISNVYADQIQSGMKTYLIRVTSENPNQQTNAKISYMLATSDGKIAHYQITQATPFETEFTADQVYALFTSDNNMLNVEISLKTKEGKQFLSSATGHGIVATEGPGANSSITGL